jgi:hypothetical protein
VYFRYEVEDHGWSTARLGPDDHVVEMTVSYLQDSLKDLAAATLALCGGAPEAEMFFEDEPGVHWLKLRRLGPSALQFEILWQDDWDKPLEQKCSGQCALAEFKDAVTRELKRILAENGEPGYRRKTIDFDFPGAELRALEALKI